MEQSNQMWVEDAHSRFVALHMCSGRQGTGRGTGRLEMGFGAFTRCQITAHFSIMAKKTCGMLLEWLAEQLPIQPAFSRRRT